MKSEAMNTRRWSMLLALAGLSGGAIACDSEAPRTDDAAPTEGGAADAAEVASEAASVATATPLDSDLGPLLDPTDPEMNATAPELFRAGFETTGGDFVIEVHRAWAPNGADRFYNLVRHGFYDGTRFFRVLEGFVAQWGINGGPAINAAWVGAQIPGDPVVESNTRGRVTYAMGGSPDSRTTQLFINYGDNSNLDPSGFAPFGEVVSGMDVVDQLYAGYGEGAPRGQGPAQGRIQSEGNAYLEVGFPDLDHVIRATIAAPE